MSYRPLTPPPVIGPWARFSQTGRGANFRGASSDEQPRGVANDYPSAFGPFYRKKGGAMSSQTGQGGNFRGGKFGWHQGREGQRLGEGPTTWGAQVPTLDPLSLPIRLLAQKIGHPASAIAWTLMEGVRGLESRCSHWADGLDPAWSPEGFPGCALRKTFALVRGQCWQRRERTQVAAEQLQ